MDRLNVTFDSQGTTCSGWLYLPEGEPPHPVIVMAHGLGAVREMRLDAYAKRFTAAGYACLVFDYRYFGDSGGEPRQLLDWRKQLQDYAAAVRYVRSCRELNADRVVVWGTSFSGGHAIVTAANDRRIAAAIAQCPFTDGIASALAMSPRSSVKVSWHAVRDVLGAWQGKSPRRIPLVGPPHSAALMTAQDALPGFLGLVPEGLAFRNEAAARIGVRILFYRPARRTKHVTCPILFGIAERDTVAPAGPTKRAAACAPLGESRVYAAGHFDLYTGQEFEMAVGSQLEFLSRHVPVKSD